MKSFQAALTLLTLLAGCQALERQTVEFATDEVHDLRAAPRDTHALALTTDADTELAVDTALLNARFEGSSREKAKTTISNAALEDTYEDLDDLLDTLRTDAYMRGGSPRRVTSSKPRIIDEQRNVRVKAWLYAVKLESDRDFHLILGERPGDAHPDFLNVEVSALPKTSGSNDAKFKRVRTQLHGLFGRFPGRTRYFKVNPPLPVEVEGSLFYDIDHPPGEVGTNGWNPKTSWEIHPVTNLKRRDDE